MSSGDMHTAALYVVFAGKSSGGGYCLGRLY